VERLQTEVKSCSSVPTPFLDGLDFARLVVVGREQAKNEACATAFYCTGGVVVRHDGACRFRVGHGSPLDGYRKGDA
jgi:hypothetical protein